uniref:Uncharacterized protein n=1 Tax=Leersia perrieri TaxID=77586 RepID=A0A0D9V8T7_9ORYZ
MAIELEEQDPHLPAVNPSRAVRSCRSRGEASVGFHSSMSLHSDSTISFSAVGVKRIRHGEEERQEREQEAAGAAQRNSSLARDRASLTARPGARVILDAPASNLARPFKLL